MPGTWTLPDTGGALPFPGAPYQNEEEKGEKQSKLKSKKPKHTQKNPSPLPLPAQPQLGCLSWRKCPRCAQWWAHDSCCSLQASLQLTTPSHKKPPVNSMETFIESIPFPGNDLFHGKNNIPKKLECVPCSLSSQWIPRKSEAFEWKSKKCNQFLLLVCLKVEFMLQDLPEQVPMPLPRF